MSDGAVTCHQRKLLELGHLVNIEVGNIVKVQLEHAEEGDHLKRIGAGREP